MNIAQLISNEAQRHPHRQAVVMPTGKDACGRYLYAHYTYARFDYESNCLAERLREIGFKPGLKTLLFVRPSLAFPLITFALFKLGAVPILIDPGMGRKNLLRAIAEVKPEALIAEPIVHALRLIGGRALRNVKIAITTGKRGYGLATPLVHLLPRATDYGNTPFAMHQSAASDLAAILFTSGGTGKPKGVLYTHGVFAEQVELIRELFDLKPGDKDLAGFPLFSLLTMAMGVTSVIPPMDPSRPAAADPAALVQTIYDQAVTTANGSPAIWERVGQYCQDHHLSLPSLRGLIMYGAPVASSLHSLFAPLLPNGTTYTPYGATECLPVTVISGREVLAETAAATARGQGTCVGRPASRTQLAIIAPSSQAIASWHAVTALPSGSIGEIVVAGAQATHAYYEEPAATARAKICHDDGKQLWHRMGDLGYIDAAGRLWFCGRQAHMLSIGGSRLYSVPCEAIFNAHPEVRRSALIAWSPLPDEEDKTEACLVVERRDHRTTLAADEASAFRAALLQLGAQYPHTRGIKTFFLHASLPVDPRHNIKIDRIGLQRYFMGKSAPRSL